MAIALGCDPWDTIVIVIALNTIHNDFDSIIANFLEVGDKSIDQIQIILQSKKAKNISKQSTGVVTKMAMLFKNNQRMKNAIIVTSLAILVMIANPQ